MADNDHWTCGGCGHEGNGPDTVEWTEHTKGCPDLHRPAEPDAGDVEALADLFMRSIGNTPATKPTEAGVRVLARNVLHSNWLAAHDAEVRRETAERAWVEGWDAAVDAAEKCDVAGPDMTCGECAICMTPNPYTREEASRG